MTTVNICSYNNLSEAIVWNCILLKMILHFILAILHMNTDQQHYNLHLLLSQWSWSDVVHVLRTSVDCTLLSRRDTTDDEREAGTPHCCTQCSLSVSWPLITSSTLCSSVTSEWGHSLVVSTVSQMMLASVSTQHPVTQCVVMSLNTHRHHPRTGQLLITDTYTDQWSYTGW